MIQLRFHNFALRMYIMYVHDQDCRDEEDILARTFVPTNIQGYWSSSSMTLEERVLLAREVS